MIPKTGINPKVTFTSILKRELGVTTTQADQAWSSANKVIAEKNLLSKLKTPKTSADVPGFKADLKWHLGVASGTSENLMVAIIPLYIAIPLVIGAIGASVFLIKMASEEMKKNKSFLMKEIQKLKD